MEEQECLGNEGIHHKSNKEIDSNKKDNNKKSTFTSTFNNNHTKDNDRKNNRRHSRSGERKSPSMLLPRRVATKKLARLQWT